MSAHEMKRSEIEGRLTWFSYKSQWKQFINHSVNATRRLCVSTSDGEFILWEYQGDTVEDIDENWSLSQHKIIMERFM